jgi:rhamnose transport system permease protein
MLNKIISAAGRWESILVLFILVAAVLGWALSPHFLNTENLWSQSRSFIVVGFLALGLAPVVVTGNIDLSGESVLAICAVILGLLYKQGVNVWEACVVVVILGSLIGLLNGVLTAVFGLPSLVVTLASLISFRGLAYVILGEHPIAGFPDSFVALGNGNLGATLIPQSLVAFGTVSLVIFVMLHLTIWGRRLYAIGANPASAALSGVPVRRMQISAFVLSGALAGCASILLAARYNSVRADVATGVLLSVLTVVLLGGISIFGGSGNLGGLLLSLVLVGLIQNGMSLANIAEEGQHLIVGALLIAAVVIPRLISGLGSHRLSQQRSGARSDAHDRQSG